MEMGARRICTPVDKCVSTTLRSPDGNPIDCFVAARLHCDGSILLLARWFDIHSQVTCISYKFEVGKTKIPFIGLVLLKQTSLLQIRCCGSTSLAWFSSSHLDKRRTHRD